MRPYFAVLIYISVITNIGVFAYKTIVVDDTLGPYVAPLSNDYIFVDDGMITDGGIITDGYVAIDGYFTYDFDVGADLAFITIDNGVFANSWCLVKSRLCDIIGNQGNTPWLFGRIKIFSVLCADNIFQNID